MNNTIITLYEGVLNDDQMEILENGYYYQNHNKATVCLTYYIYANEWSNNKHMIFAKTPEAAMAKYLKATHRDQDTERFNEDWSSQC